MDIGWTKWDLDKVEYLRDEISEELIIKDGNFFSEVFKAVSEPNEIYNTTDNKKTLIYKISSPWIISEIEEVLSHTLLLFEKIIFKIPYDFDFWTVSISGFHYDSGVYINYRILTKQVLENLSYKLGDAI